MITRESSPGTDFTCDYIISIYIFFYSRITPNLRNIVYSAGVKNADEATWDEVFQKFISESVPSEKRKLMYALTNSRNKEILSR